MNSNRSVATIDAPEFINLEPDAINPGISKCEIKVFYLGKNRNGSFIDKNTAIQMSNSLPGTPIVGVYKKDIEDFGDHGDVIHIENGKVEFSCSTIPYGFVSPDTQVWFQKFEETNDFGETVIRDYLMTNGYLWTGQYPEVTECITSGKGQSMELDPQKTDGHWARDDKTGIDFFIINDTVFSKLCILGDDVEPCFEGAAVTAPEVSKNFSVNDFSHTLYNMMNELKFALQNKGGSDMPEDTQEVLEEVEELTEVEAGDADVTEEVEEDFACGGGSEKKKKKNFSEDGEDSGDESDESDESEGEGETSDEEDETPDTPAEDDSNEDDEEPESEVAEDDEPARKKPSDYELLQEQYEALQAEIAELRQFKLDQENAEKDSLIAKYHMLSEEDKADVIANKEQYSLAEIEEKLALIYVKKNVDFSTVDGQQEEEVVEEEDSSLTFSLDTDAGFVPPLVEALRQTKRN